MFMTKNCFLLCVSGLTIACIICCRVNVTLDMILGIEDILISWFVIMELLHYSFVVRFTVSICVSQMQINSLTYLQTIHLQQLQLHN